MLVTLSPKVTDVMLVLLSPNQLPIVLQFKSNDVMLVQPEKALSPMLVTPLPMVTEVRPLQEENALLPMLVTLLGISMLVRPLQFSKAEPPMLVTLLGISMLVRPLQPSYL